MGKLPIDIVNLAHKVTEALATAFPERAKMVAPPAKSRLAKAQTADAPLAALACTHEKSESLATRLSNHSQCSICTIFGPINEIQEVQQEFVNRGGAFLSREKDEYHKTLKSKWRRSKIALMKMVALYELLISDPQVSTHDKAELQLGLEAYEQRKAVLARVPGVEYTEGAEEEEPTEEEMEVVRLMMELLEKVLDKEMEAEDKEYAAKWAAITTTEEPLKPWTQRTAKKKLAKTMWQPRTLPTDASTSQPVESPLTPRPILKHQQSLPSVSSAQNKRICIAETATISPAHLNVRNPSRFIIEPERPTMQPHSKHATGENKRTRGEFWRPGPAYTPGQWASQAYEEKEDTSNMKVDWNEIIKYEEAVTAKWKEVNEKMKSIAKTWVETRGTRKVVESHNVKE